MARQTFGKRERLLKWPEFQNVMNRGKRKRIESWCTVFWLDRPDGNGRLGIIASRKIGGATVRNACKRRIREIYRRNKDKIKPALDVVVISGKGMTDLPFSVLEERIVGILQA